MPLKKKDTRKRGSVFIDLDLHGQFKSLLRQKKHGPMNLVITDFVRAYLQAPDQLRSAVTQILAGGDPFSSGGGRVTPIKPIQTQKVGILGAMAKKAKS